MLSPTLPGFEPEHIHSDDAGLGDAARATIGAYMEAGQLTGRHALTAQLLIATADRAGSGLREPKTSIATTNLVRLLADLLDRLPQADESVGDAAQQFLAALHEAEARAGSH
ncbi:MAG: hypothetical protein E7L00_08430 [Propionibacteriaceae bacterium]|nr:hypothetical protein [Propionibacteriaceae bacterium]